jgi:hypothetical protein
MLAELYMLAQGEGQVADRARFALQITEQHGAGQISDDEYRELMQDLARLDEVQLNSAELEAKTILVTAIWAVAQLR